MADGLTIYEEAGPDRWLASPLDLDDLELQVRHRLLMLMLMLMLHLEKHHHLFPSHFWPVLCKDLNGSFHCDDVLDDESNLVKHISWSCFKIKLVREPHQYEWVQTTVFLTWYPDTQRQVVYIIDFPIAETEFLNLVPPARSRNRNPYVWHTAFAGAIIQQYDKSIWGLRDLVRTTEKARVDTNNLTPDFFPHLHDITRHIFHSNETLDIAEHTLQSLVREQARSCELFPAADKRAWLQNERELLFRAKELHSLRTRSRSLAERLHNEINLGFNLVSQRFGSDAKYDSAMMKTVAIVSMVYLPGTFVSGLFGTNFFDYNDGNEVMTSSFWIYWAITIPLTLATMLAWACWHYYPWRRQQPLVRPRVMTFLSGAV
ncbi:hypothetical protein BO71DRAFT_423980 [Aspergillus ellipticus CBS 707.79]|uniref:Uncharacterized protein n=1 Tax=Aspergillus ellipticus CBS 707.79 TaxID=1448320 RepID=A0A319DAC1_9EURO|nr:hypothetical protein BO71DRAFT_423980 [Aspergillus ellipticus CBS 707.79]